jgi:hypothetical protein
MIRSMAGTRWIGTLGMVAAFLLAPSAASADAVTSPGVSLVQTIPERGVVSAKAAGNLLYVSSLGGVTIYDISNPRQPARVSRLDLPNAQNEDVDVGSGVLLVSDDPFGGRGILHVIDVRDPANPRLSGTVTTWVPGAGFLTPPGARPPRIGGIGHTASCIQQCQWAWLAGSPEGIDVVDLRDPANPKLAGRVKVPEVARGGLGTHDVQVDSQGLAWVAGSYGTAAYDVTNPLRPKVVFRTGREAQRGVLNGLIHHNSQRIGQRTVAVTEEDFAEGCGRDAGSLQTYRIGRGGKLRNLDRFTVEPDRTARLLCSAHYFEERNGLIAQGFYQAGTRLLDVSNPSRIRQVGWFAPPDAMVWGAQFPPTDPSGQTVYVLDHQAGLHVLAIDRAALRPARRNPPNRPAATNVGMIVADEGDFVRPGARVGYAIAAFNGGPGRPGPVTVTATLPPQLLDVRPEPGVKFDPATRILSASFPRVRGFRVRAFAARVDPATPLGTSLEVIGFASTPGDRIALDDRGVDRNLVSNRRNPRPPEPAAAAATARARAAAAAAVLQGRAGFCRLPL